MSQMLALSRPRTYWALGGPLLLGALPGLRIGLGATLRLGPSLLAALLATALIMGPALYLLWGLTGAKGSLEEVRRAFVDALTAAGRVHVGFAPAVLLLAATVSSRDHALVFGLAAFLGGLLVGAVRLWRALQPGASRTHAAVVLVPWLVASAIVGCRLAGQFVMPVLSGKGV
jgi:hypothetical protein